MHTFRIAASRRMWSGLLAGAALTIGLSLLGDTPDTRDPTASVARYFVEHRTNVLIGVVLIGMATVAFLWLIAAIGTAFSSTHEHAPPFIQSTATVVASIVLVTTVVPYSALGYIIGAESPGLAKGLLGITLVAAPVVAGPLAALTLTVGLAGRRIAARWFSALSTAAGVVFAVSMTAYAARGPLSPHVQQQVVFQLTVVWLVAASFGITKRPSGDRITALARVSSGARSGGTPADATRR